MKTALDLPDDLVREIKIEAAKRGAKLKDLIAELLRVGLDSPRQKGSPVARLTTDSRTGLLVVANTHSPGPEMEMSPSRVTEILQHQEEKWTLEAGR